MSVDRVTVRSQSNSKCGAYPMGSGLVFMADNFEAFEHSTHFHGFMPEDYAKWKEARLQDPAPLRDFEPVAAFSMEENITVSFDVDFKRPSKYIMLMPTGFRNKPSPYSQYFKDMPMEIEFFGVQGSAYPSQHQASPIYNANPVKVKTGYAIEGFINGSTTPDFTLYDIELS